MISSILNHSNRLRQASSIIFIVVSFLLINRSQGQSNAVFQERNIKVRIPTQWIENLQGYRYTQDNESILLDFEKLIEPDTLVGSKTRNQYEKGIVNPMFINLDNDLTDELICLVGWSENDPMLCVFKKFSNDWYLIFTEPFYIYYSAPELQVANNYSQNKTFYIRWLYERGSGVYRDSYHFYKLIDGKVYHCLELVNEARIYGWGMYLNQDISMTFKFNNASVDAIWVVYNYNFFPGSVYEKDAPWDAHPDLSFVKGKEGIEYIWNAPTNEYKPSFYGHTDGLTQEKINCFGAFGNDSLFVRAYDYEINHTLQDGNDEQKRLLKEYLDTVQQQGNAISPTGGLEEKGQVGKLKLYGTPKKDK